MADFRCPQCDCMVKGVDSSPNPVNGKMIEREEALIDLSI